MAARVFSVGSELPGGVAEHVPLRSEQSLFDGDVILFWPHFDDYISSDWYSGHHLLTEHHSVRVTEDVAHWRSELKTAVENGKVIFVFMKRPEKVYYDTGNRSHSGTGRSRITTRHVASIDSYSCLPLALEGLTPRSGKEIAVISELGPMAAYWHEFGPMSAYEAYYDPGSGQDILGTKKREKVVGTILRTKSGGAIVLIPPLVWDEEALFYYRGDKFYWRKEAQRLGARLVTALVSASEAIRRSGRRSAAPTWLLDGDYKIEAAQVVEAEIEKTDQKLKALADRRVSLVEKLEEARSLQDLLFESGTRLEVAILKVLRAMGFAAEGIREGESEFDAVFSAAEGRFLGEAEGKETKAINIGKMSQLERNLQEDFARDEVEEYAKGVLFGNAFRFTPPSERDDFFTTKCRSAARRLGIALVRTPDLFVVGRYLMQHRDSDFATACRRAILGADGEVVQFAVVPSEEAD